MRVLVTGSNGYIGLTGSITQEVSKKWGEGQLFLEISHLYTKGSS